MQKAKNAMIITNIKRTIRLYGKDNILVNVSNHDENSGMEL